MRGRMALFAAALTLFMGVAVAQAKDTGTVVRLDFPANVVMLDGGRMYRMTPSTVLTVDDRQVAFKALQPGARVTVENGQPVMYRDRKYIALKPVPAPQPMAQTPAPGLTQTPPSALTEPPPAVQPSAIPPPRVVQSPPAPPPAAERVAASEEPTTMRRTIAGTVTEISSDGTLHIQTGTESFEARVSRDALRDINEGDTVVIELSSIGPPGSASPR